MSVSNFEQFKAMTATDLAEWLDKYGQSDDLPWENWFYDNYCTNCAPIVLKGKEAEEKLRIHVFSARDTFNCAYCELYQTCKFFPTLKELPDNKTIIEMWLNAEAE